MRFRLTADCYFEAKDLDDAILQLAEHFRALYYEGAEAPVIFEPESKITIRGADQPAAAHQHKWTTAGYCSECSADKAATPDQQSAVDDVQYCECATPVPREPAGSSIEWCNSCGFDIRPDPKEVSLCGVLDGYQFSRPCVLPYKHEGDHRFDAPADKPSATATPDR
jgi:hypothetical protein